MKKYFTVSGTSMDYLEGLRYQYEGYKQIIRYLSCQKEINEEVIQSFSNKYETIYTEYNMALNLACKENIPQEILERDYFIYPKFNIGCLVVAPMEKRCSL